MSQYRTAKKYRGGRPRKKPQSFKVRNTRRTTQRPKNGITRNDSLLRKRQRAQKILNEYPDDRGFDLALKISDGYLYLYDAGGAKVDITNYNDSEIRKEIEDWISLADEHYDYYNEE